jgi:hypothetical protein
MFADISSEPPRNHDDAGDAYTEANALLRRRARSAELGALRSPTARSSDTGTRAVRERSERAYPPVARFPDTEWK